MLGQRVADGVRHVDRRGACLDHLLEDAAQKIDIGARRRLRRKTPTLSVYSRAHFTARTACSITCDGSMRSLFSM